jgi:hypothetical protein
MDTPRFAEKVLFPIPPFPPPTAMTILSPQNIKILIYKKKQHSAISIMM